MKVGNKYKVKWMNTIQEATIITILKYEHYTLVQVSMVDTNSNSIASNLTFFDYVFESIIIKSTWSCKPLYRRSL